MVGVVEVDYWIFFVWFVVVVVDQVGVFVGFEV